MISKKDVITIRLPFPNLNSGLAQKAHMYICKSNVNSKKEILKVQTFKPLILRKVSNYLIEKPDNDRNPFRNVSLIDLDKQFNIIGIRISREALCGGSRTNVCDELFELIIYKINDSIIQKEINTDDLILLNRYCTRY